MILGFVLPDHLIGGGIDFHDGAAVGAGAMRAVVEDGNVAVGQPLHVVRAEKHLIAVVVVAGSIGPLRRQASGKRYFPMPWVAGLP